MRRPVRLFSEVGPEARLGTAIAALPPSVQHALTVIADREDLPLVAGDWGRGDGGCLVANVCRAMGDSRDTGSSQVATVDLRVLELLPEMSSRDLNLLIVAWDEAAMQEGRTSDAALRRLLRGGLARAGLPPTLAGGPDSQAPAVAGGGPEPESPVPEPSVPTALQGSR